MKTKKIVDITLHNLLLAFLAFIWLIPIVWLVATSFSAYTGMNTSTFFPKEWSIANYKNLLFSADTVAQFPNWFKNTFIIACCSCLISSSFAVFRIISCRSFCDLIVYVFLSMQNNPLYGCTTVCLSTHLAKNILVASK